MPDPDLTPAAEKAVRDLLAGARHDGPIPAEVAARLDAALEELQEERAAERPPAAVVPLSRAARRRRLAGGALVAAAAVVVAGVGIGQLGVGTGSEGDSASVAGDAGGQSREERSQDLEAPEEYAGSDSLQEESATLRTDAFRQDVRRLAPATALARARPRTPGCEVPGAGRGTWVPVTYDGQAGVLVYRTPRGGAQRVDLYLCGSGTIARTVVLQER